MVETPESYQTSSSSNNNFNMQEFWMKTSAILDNQKQTLKLN